MQKRSETKWALKHCATGSTAVQCVGMHKLRHGWKTLYSLHQTGCLGDVRMAAAAQREEGLLRAHADPSPTSESVNTMYVSSRPTHGGYEAKSLKFHEHAPCLPDGGHLAIVGVPRWQSTAKSEALHARCMGMPYIYHAGRRRLHVMYTSYNAACLHDMDMMHNAFDDKFPRCSYCSPARTLPHHTPHTVNSRSTQQVNISRSTHYGPG